MPRGTPTTPANQRSAIIVADHDGLLQHLTNIYDSQFSVKDVLFLPFYKLPEKLTKKISLLAVSKMDEAEIIALIERELSLNVKIAHYTPEEADNLFHFEVGHTPQNGMLYICHPIQNERYILPIDFSQTLAREREAAFRQLAIALGAKTISLKSVEVKNKEGKLETNVELKKQVAEEIGANITFDKQGRIERETYAEFGKTLKSPHVPEKLQPWIDADPELRTMVYSRTEANQLLGRVRLEFKQTFDVGGHIAAKVAGQGGHIGGAYKEMSHSIWSFEVEYWDLS